MREATKRLLLYFGLVSALVTFINSYDYQVFRNWVIAANLVGILDIYKASVVLGHPFRVVYPPLAPLLFIASASLVVALYPAYILLAYPPLVMRAVLKAPLVLSVLVGYEVFRKRVGVEAARLLLYNVLLILLLQVYVFDIPASIAAGLALIMLDAPVVAALLLSTATLLKQNFALLAIPVLLYYLYRGSRREAVVFMLTYVVSSIAVLLPFALINGFNVMLNYMLFFHASRPPQGPTLWTLLLVETGYNAQLASRFSGLWVVVYAALSLYALYKLRSRLGTQEGVLALSAALLIAMLVSSKVVNPQYFAWPLPLLAILASRGLLGRERVRDYTLAGLIAIAYPVLVPFTAAVIGAPVYLEEEARWLSPDETRRLVVDAAPELAPLLLRVFRENPVLYAFANLVYHSWPIILPMLSITYTVLLARVYVSLLQRDR